MSETKKKKAEHPALQKKKKKKEKKKKKKKKTHDGHAFRDGGVHTHVREHAPVLQRAGRSRDDQPAAAVGNAVEDAVGTHVADNAVRIM